MLLKYFTFRFLKVRDEFEKEIFLEKLFSSRLELKKIRVLKFSCVP